MACDARPTVTFLKYTTHGPVSDETARWQKHMGMYNLRV